MPAELRLHQRGDQGVGGVPAIRAELPGDERLLLRRPAPDLLRQPGLGMGRAVHRIVTLDLHFDEIAGHLAA